MKKIDILNWSWLYLQSCCRVTFFHQNACLDSIPLNYFHKKTPLKQCTCLQSSAERFVYVYSNYCKSSANNVLFKAKLIIFLWEIVELVMSLLSDSHTEIKISECWLHNSFMVDDRRPLILYKNLSLILYYLYDSASMEED